jgi:protein-S-isoprenylcysteine O-methyltransferase Ste14
LRLIAGAETVMAGKIVAYIARHAGKERPRSIRIMTLVIGLLVFLIAIPVALGLLSHWISGYVTIGIPGTVELFLGITGICAGIFFLFWSISTFWIVGKGTPVPFASPTKLVTGGPFKYTRNPIKLGAVLFYFGLGTIYDGFVTGLVMLVIGVALGTTYHRSVEEKELALRFGKEYEEYRKRTSFFIPLPPKSL